MLNARNFDLDISLILEFRVLLGVASESIVIGFYRYLRIRHIMIIGILRIMVIVFIREDC